MFDTLLYCVGAGLIFLGLICALAWWGIVLGKWVPFKRGDG